MTKNSRRKIRSLKAALLDWRLSHSNFAVFTERKLLQESTRKHGKQVDHSCRALGSLSDGEL
jgi:hypothetical protein